MEKQLEQLGKVLQEYSPSQKTPEEVSTLLSDALKYDRRTIPALIKSLEIFLAKDV